MSRLRELRVHGFKTFADATRFVFEPGVNAVIGPNGSGKSNMADAVRWVLGEQSNRALRTRRADDVIFAGSQQRRPTGMAEVLMTLDNSDGWLPIDFAEVTIGRRAYRSGEAEYLVNGARARMRDVVELLAAGHLGAGSLVVVGQGTVDAALSLRPEERRQLFEEAAGVKNLQVRKNEALSRLDRARDNVARVRDLLGELRPQVRRLALQAQHQQQHDALRQRGDGLVRETFRRKEAALHEALGEARRRAAAAEAAVEEARADQRTRRSAIDAVEGRYWEADRSWREASEEREATHETALRLEGRLDAAERRRAELLAAIAGADAEIARADEELTSPSAAPTQTSAVAAALDAAAEAERRWQDALAAMAEADADLLAAEEALARARGEAAERMADQARRTEEQAALAARRDRLTGERSRLEGVAAELEERVAVLRRAREAASMRATAARATLEEARARAGSAHAAARQARLEATSAAEQMAEVQAAIDALAEPPSEAGRLGRRLVASGWRALVDVVDAPPAAWLAIEAVVGGDLAEALLWRDADVAVAAGDARGSARLLDGRRSQADEERAAALAAVGGSWTLAEWVGDRGDQLPGFFTRVAIAPNLAALISGWRSLPLGWTAVTPNGDVADGRGILTVRGRGDSDGSEATRRGTRRSELAARLAERQTGYAKVADAAAAAVAAAGAAERQLREAESVSAVAGGDLTRAEDALANDEREAARAATELERVGEAIAEAAAAPDLPGHGPATSGADGSLPDLGPLERQAAAARARRMTTAGELEAARAAWQELQSRARDLEAGSAGERQRLADLEGRRRQAAASRDSLTETLRASEREIDDLRGAVETARGADLEAGGRRADRDRAREAARAELLELERSRSGTDGRVAELEAAHQAAAIEVSRSQEKLASLSRERATVLDAFLADVPESEAASGDQAADPRGSASASVEPSALSLPVAPELAAELAGMADDALEAELRRVRRALGQIGSVNPFAVEEHRDLSHRLDDLSTQEHDLAAAIDSTTELISRLDSEISGRFGAAFRAIGERFDEFVRLLFAGGSASLELAAGEDGEAQGIEIVVRPPGKRPQRLAVLSGGERALTGVALLFAMLSVNPVPFCVLDEVDAALDEANIGRFAAALRTLAERIDFVVITHNRATIEIADTIYGVTMSDAAVSRVLSLRLADLPAAVTA